MPSAPYFPHGSTMTIDGTPILGLLDIPIPTAQRGEVEITQQGDWTRKYRPGLKDFGTTEFTCRMINDDPGQIALRENHEADGETAEFVITTAPHVSPQVTWTFDAYVSTWGGVLPWENGSAAREIGLRVVTEPVEAVVAGES
jgi:hypothetical protein